MDSKNKPSTVNAVVFDWAGTVIDFGSQAPMGAFVSLFANEGVAITVAQARQPMGLPKWHHIHALGQQADIAAAWEKAKGSAMSHADVDRLYAVFTPMNAHSVLQHSALIPGVLDVVAGLRARGIKIGSTTGYNRAIADVLQPLASAQGFNPDNLVCADDFPLSRPTPMGMYQCFLQLGAYPACGVVKVDDTVPGLLEGSSAHCWTVGILASGNAVGLSHEAWHSLAPSQQAVYRDIAKEQLMAANPDYLIDTVADLLPVIHDIEQALAMGYLPGQGLRRIQT